MEARYLVDQNGERIGVLLDIEEYERIIEQLEELEDIRSVDEARAELDREEDELVPWEQAKTEIEEERARLKRDGLV